MIATSQRSRLLFLLFIDSNSDSHLVIGVLHFIGIAGHLALTYPAHADTDGGS